MTPREQWEGVRALFHRALGLPAEERVAFVRRETADEVTRAEVEALLAAHQEADGFLSDPAAPPGGALDTPSARLTPGTRLGVFEILGPLGSGGMGEVYRARDTRLNREVAIKVLARELAADQRSRDRFEHEARAVSQLRHPHICALYDVGSWTVDGIDAQYLVMELIDGETLSSRLHRGALPVDQALEVAVEILDALSCAHESGVVHRDLKPANVMLTKSGVKLLDFGLARLSTPGVAGHSSAANDEEPLTAPGLVLGTVPYMSPEQVRGEDADARSDIFSFGAVFYELLSGRRAFNAASGPAQIAAILQQEPPPLADDAPYPALDRLLRGCLAKSPQERWQHAGDVALALRALGKGPERSASPSSGQKSAPSASWPPGPRWRLHAGWAAVATLLAAGVWLAAPAPRAVGPAANAEPVVVLMDSPLEGRVYDPRTLAAGGTNADDITDALRGLPVTIYKENTSPMWHREENVRHQNPDLIVSHLSCLYDQRVSEDAAIRRHLFDVAQTRLVGFFGYLATVNPRTKYLVYSRGRFGAPEGVWTDEVLARFPQMGGRVFTLTVPGAEKATFRDPEVVKELRLRVVKILGLRDVGL